MTNGKDMLEFNPRLHGLRALAAIGVLLFHWAAMFPVHQHLHALGEPYGFFWFLSFFTGFGWVGVPLFFVLSGFLLTSQLLARPRPLLQFWQRRALRIYPGVWFQILVMAGLAYFIAGLPYIKWEWTTAANILLFINLPPWYIEPINGVWWTLPVELSFYLLLPLLLRLSQKISFVGTLLLAVLLSIGWRWGLMAYLDLPNYSGIQTTLDALPGTLIYFCCGMAVAVFAREVSVSARILILLLGASSLLGLLGGIIAVFEEYWRGHWLLIVWPVLCAPTIALIVFAASRPIPGLSLLSSRPLVFWGEISFGVYLWHYPVLGVIKAYWPGHLGSLGSSCMVLALCLAVTTCLASISYYFVERPLMKWRRSLPQR